MSSETGREIFGALRPRAGTVDGRSCQSLRQSDKGMVLRQSPEGWQGDQPRRRTWDGGGKTQELERLSVPKNAVFRIKDMRTDLH